MLTNLPQNRGKQRAKSNHEAVEKSTEPSSSATLNEATSHAEDRVTFRPDDSIIPDRLSEIARDRARTKQRMGTDSLVPTTTDGEHLNPNRPSSSIFAVPTATPPAVATRRTPLLPAAGPSTHRKTTEETTKISPLLGTGLSMRGVGGLERSDTASELRLLGLDDLSQWIGREDVRDVTNARGAKNPHVFYVTLHEFDSCDACSRAGRVCRYPISTAYGATRMKNCLTCIRKCSIASSPARAIRHLQATAQHVEAARGSLKLALGTVKSLAPVDEEGRMRRADADALSHVIGDMEEKIAHLDSVVLTIEGVVSRLEGDGDAGDG